MFGIDSTEFLVIGLVALVVIGPKDLPRVMRMVGQWVAKGRSMTRHIRSGFDEMMRQAELDEMQKQWAAQNEAIMRGTAVHDVPVTPPVEPVIEPVIPANAGTHEHGQPGENAGASSEPPVSIGSGVRRNDIEDGAAVTP